MSDKAMEAYHEFSSYLDAHGARLHPDEESFLAGYAAASADTERLMTEAVRVTIRVVAALQSKDNSYFAGDIETGLSNNIDASAVIRRVMRENNP